MKCNPFCLFVCLFLSFFFLSFFLSILNFENFALKSGRRLEAEHHDMQNAEDSDLSGFLFVREEDDQSEVSCWNLKWCELGKKELKAV